MPASAKKLTNEPKKFQVKNKQTKNVMFTLIQNYEVLTICNTHLKLLDYILPSQHIL